VSAPLATIWSEDLGLQLLPPPRGDAKPGISFKGAQLQKPFSRFLKRPSEASINSDALRHTLELTREAVARRIEAEEARAHSEAELHAVFGAMRAVVLVLSCEGRYLRIPSTNADRLYMPPESMLGRTVHEVLPQAEADGICATIRLALTQPAPLRTAYTLVIEGKTIYFDAVVSRLDADTVVWVAHDVTPHREAELAVRAGHETLRSTMDAAPQAIVAVDTRWNITLWNRAAEEMLGWTASEVLGKPLPYIPDSELAAFAASQSVEAHEPGMRALETRRVRKDGKVLDVLLSTSVLRDATGKHTGFIALLADLSDRKALEAKLQQAQKLEAVGQLAGGIAHDFNNLLTVILGNTGFLLESLPPASTEANDVTEIRNAAQRAAELTAQLLTFGRRQIVRPRNIDFGTVIDGVGPMLRRLIGEDIQVSVSPTGAPMNVLADPGQLELLIMNLAFNARDAMPRGGTLSIESTTVQIAAGAEAAKRRMPAGSYVLLRVRDNGSGMDAATQARMFEPFFTTKMPGTGGGLGLSTVYGIVKQSGGFISCESAVGRGTTFDIHLPQAAASDGAQPTSATSSTGGTETVLVVEDEDSLRAITRRILMRQGYSVVEARDGQEALTLLNDASARIAIVLTDVVMPVMNGRLLADRIAVDYPRIPVVFMSGYTDDDILRRGVLPAGSGFIQKPFTPEILARSVREGLDRASVVSAGESSVY